MAEPSRFPTLGNRREITLGDYLGALVAQFLFPGLAAAIVQEETQHAFDALPNTALSAPEVAAASVRGLMTDETVVGEARLTGFNADRLSVLQKLSMQHIPADLVISAWRRKLIDTEEYRLRMHLLGYQEEAIDIISAATEYYPTPQDLITWQSREVYEADSVDRYGLADELDKIDPAPFAKAGINPEQLRNYWIAHWQQPSWTEVQRFLHWELMTPEQVQEWFRIVEIPPYWRKMFTDTAYQPLTRVDVRRMWDLQVVDDDEVVKVYMREGYRREDAESLLTFTKLERTVPELRNRYKNGWINEFDIRAELTRLSLPEDKLERIIQTIIKFEVDERTAPERDLTKTEIIKLAKLRKIDRVTAIGMLIDLGYNPQEAEMVIVVNLDGTTSPETPLEMLRIVRFQQRATGKDVALVPNTAIDAERKYIVDYLAYEDCDKSDSDAVAGARKQLDASESLYVQLLSMNSLLPYKVDTSIILSSRNESTGSSVPSNTG